MDAAPTARDADRTRCRLDWHFPPSLGCVRRGGVRLRETRSWAAAAAEAYSSRQVELGAGEDFPDGGVREWSCSVGWASGAGRASERESGLRTVEASR